MEQIIKKPVISEKSMKLAKLGLYTFIVGRDFDKNQITNLIEKYFKVNVVSIKTSNFKDKVEMQRNRKGKFVRFGYKKAVIRVKKGQKIALFAAEEEEKEQTKPEVKEKKGLLSGTKVKIERTITNKSNQAKKEADKEVKEDKK